MDATPEKSKSLDKIGMCIEIAIAGGSPDWDELAVRLGSASGSSLKKTWQNLKNNHVIRRKGEDGTLSPKAKKVTKPKTPRKKATPKKAAPKKAKKDKKAVEEDAEMDSEHEDDIDASESNDGIKAEANDDANAQLERDSDATITDHEMQAAFKMEDEAK